MTTSAALLALAHPNYYEDSGTPKGDDDYGYEGLKEVLQKAGFTRVRLATETPFNLVIEARP